MGVEGGLMTQDLKFCEANTSAPSVHQGVTGSRWDPCPSVPVLALSHLPHRGSTPGGTHGASPPAAVRWLLRIMFCWHMAKRSAPTSGRTEGCAVRHQPLRRFHLHVPAGESWCLQCDGKKRQH